MPPSNAVISVISLLLATSTIVQLWFIINAFLSHCHILLHKGRTLRAVLVLAVNIFRVVVHLSSSDFFCRTARTRLRVYTYKSNVALAKEVPAQRS